jgi:hypothetical protein
MTQSDDFLFVPGLLQGALQPNQHQCPPWACTSSTLPITSSTMCKIPEEESWVNIIAREQLDEKYSIMLWEIQNDVPIPTCFDLIWADATFFLLRWLLYTFYTWFRVVVSVGGCLCRSFVEWWIRSPNFDFQSPARRANASSPHSTLSFSACVACFSGNTGTHLYYVQPFD